MCTPWNTSSSLREQTAPSLPALVLQILVCCSESHSCRLSELRGLFLALCMAWTACDSQQCCCEVWGTGRRLSGMPKSVEKQEAASLMHTVLGDAASHSLS